MSFEAPPHWDSWDPSAKANYVDLALTRREIIRELLILSDAPTAERELSSDPYLRREELARILVRLGGPRVAEPEPEVTRE